MEWIILKIAFNDKNQYQLFWLVCLGVRCSSAASIHEPPVLAKIVFNRMFYQRNFWHQPDTVVVKEIGNGAVGLGFDFWAGQIWQNVANGSPPLQRFFGALLPRRLAPKMDSATRNTIPRNTASIIKIKFFGISDYPNLCMIATNFRTFYVLLLGFWYVWDSLTDFLFHYYRQFIWPGVTTRLLYVAITRLSCYSLSDNANVGPDKQILSIRGNQFALLPFKSLVLHDGTL